MRILDEDNDKALNNVSIFLTITEAKELRDTLEQLIPHPIKEHMHVNDADYKKEITILIYEPAGDLSMLHERARRIILEDQ